MATNQEVRDVDIVLERDLFMRKMLRELTGTLENIVGLEEASSFVNTVGARMGEWIDDQYREALDVEKLSPKQVAKVFVDLKRRIGGDFYIVSLDSDKIVIGNRNCPFGDMAHDRPSLCMMTSNVFGRIAADNLGYARVELKDTIAQRAQECRIVVHLNPVEGASPDEREYYQTHADSSAGD